MAKQVWQANDGSLHPSKEEAETQDLVCEISQILVKVHRTHGAIQTGFADISPEEFKDVADVLVNTDSLFQIYMHLKEKNLLGGFYVVGSSLIRQAI